MRKLTQLASSIFALILAASGVTAFAQSQPFPLHQYYASDYGQWSLQLQAQNQYTFTPANTCQGNQPGTPSTFGLFNTNAPVEIVDVNAAHDEVVTVSSVISTGSQCGITATTAYTHNTARLVSGTAGLQESLNTLAVAALAYPANIIIDRNWYTLAAAIPGTTPQAILAAAKGNAGAVIIDTTVNPNAAYYWTGTKYTAVAGTTGGFTKPTVAAGTGAGTGGTAVVYGNGSTGVVNVATGTSPTASAAIFVLTFATAANGGFAYAPTCTVSSVGTISYTTGTNSVAYTPPASDTFTASSTALTASTATGYSFKYACQ